MLGFVIIQKGDLAAVKVKVYPVAVKANLGNGLTEIVIGVVVLITNAIKIIEELVVFIGYKVSELEVFKVAVAVTVTKRVGKGVKLLSSNSSYQLNQLASFLNCFFSLFS